MTRVKRNNKRVFKEIVKNLFNNNSYYVVHNLFRVDHGINEKIDEFLAKMPETKRCYNIVAYIDTYQGSVATDCWGLLGGADPDMFTVNGRHVGQTWNRRVISYDDSERDKNLSTYQKCFGKYSKGNITLTIMMK